MAIGTALAHNRRVPPSVEPAPGHALSDHDRERLIADDPAATFFHSAAFTGALLEAWPYYRLEWLLARDGAAADGGAAARDGAVAPGMASAPVGALPIIAARRFGIVQLFSLPYGTYGGPLAAGPDEAARAPIRAALLAAWVRRARAFGVGRAELVLAPVPGAESSEVAGATHRETRRVDLSVGFDRLWSTVLDGDVRTSCRKAEKSGVTVRSGRSDDDVDLLDRLYRTQASGWRNHTPFPGAFLPALARRAGEAFEVWVAEREGTPLAAQLLLHHGPTTVSWLAPNTPEARRWGAPTLLYVRLMEALAARGVRVLDLGGSPGHRALDEFKAGLGGRTAPYEVLRIEASWFRPLHRLQYRLRGIEE